MAVPLTVGPPLLCFTMFSYKASYCVPLLPGWLGGASSTPWGWRWRRARCWCCALIGGWAFKQRRLGLTQLFCPLVYFFDKRLQLSPV